MEKVHSWVSFCIKNKSQKDLDSRQKKKYESRAGELRREGKNLLVKEWLELTMKNWISGDRTPKTIVKKGQNPKIWILETVTKKMTQPKKSTTYTKCTILTQSDWDSSNITYSCGSHFSIDRSKILGLVSFFSWQSLQAPMIAIQD